MHARDTDKNRKNKVAKYKNAKYILFSELG